MTWGLLSERPRARLAIALGASGALLQVAGLVVLSFSYRNDPAVRQAQKDATARDLSQVVKALDEYKQKSGRYPSKLGEVVGFTSPRSLVNIQDQSGGFHALVPIYTYRLAKDGRSFDLFAVGPDGTPGTVDDIRPVLTDSELAHTGYLPGS